MKSDVSAVSFSGHAYPPAGGSAPLVAVATARGPSKNIALTSFRSGVWKFWGREGRHDLPWRKTNDPCKILVSEVMLQQTQVPRVVEKYRDFLKKFPTVRALAEASLADVLRIWSGLGYNRRAKYLHDAAKAIVVEHSGRVPRDAAALRALPGLGVYTASAIRVFAFNEPDVLIETNIRAAFIHEFFSERRVVPDSEIVPIAQKMAEGQDPRTWHWALMDYGAHVKKLHGNPARRSARHVKQSKFEGSFRQIRGAILRALADGEKTQESIYVLIRANKHIVNKALTSLARDGLIRKHDTHWQI